MEKLFFFPASIYRTWAKSQLGSSQTNARVIGLILMVNRKINVDLKECSLRLWELGWDRDFIAETLCISTTSIYRWRKIFEEYNSVKRPPSSLIGRPRIIVRAVLTAIQEVYKNEADVYLDELMWWLAIHHDIVISRSSLQQNLEEAGLTRKLLHKIAHERDAEVRAEYLAVIRDHAAGDGEEFVFVDEMSKNDHDTARQYGRSLPGERADFIDNFVRGDRYSMVAAITIDGYVATHVVPGSFNAEEF
jgi:transposase